MNGGNNGGRFTTLYNNNDSSSMQMKTFNERQKLQIFDSNDVIYEDEASIILNG